MRYEHAHYEENIDIPVLVAETARKWKWLLAAVLIGVVLFGSYKVAMRPGRASYEKNREELEELIEASRNALETNAKDIETNEKTISINQNKIEAHGEILKTQRSSRAEMEGVLKTLNEALDEARSIVADKDAPAEVKAVALEQISVLTKDILDANSTINTTARLIRTTEDEITSWQKEIDTVTIKIETLNMTREDLEEQLADQEEELQDLTPDMSKKSIIVFTAVGGVLGAIIFFGVAFLQYMFSAKLRTSKELKDRYHLHVLGEFASAASERHGKFGRRLDRLAGDIPTLPEEESIYELIAAGIRTSAEAESLKLAVTGTVDETVLHDVGGKLGTLLPKGYEITTAKNPVYNAQFLSELKEYTVLLVEAKGVSDKREIDKLAETLFTSGVTVIGVVVK